MRHRSFHSRLRSAFTLIELMVAVSILVLIILSVGVIFQSTSKAVGISQASMAMLSDVRAVQQQIERDVAGMDKNCFLVIRSGLFTDTGVTPNLVRRGDQICFIASGTFPNRTGSDSANPFSDDTVAPAALVWWGQLALQKNIASASTSSPTDPSVYLPPNQSYHLLLTQVPTGPDPQVPTRTTDSAFDLGRCTTLLMPKSTVTATFSPNSAAVAAYVNTATLSAIDYSATAVSTGEPTAADITQSRLDIAATTPNQVMSFLMQALAGSRTGANNRYEADHYCYRHAALVSPYDSENTTHPLVNGYFRTHPIVCQGVSSFAIDWTDGSVYTGGEVDVVSGEIVGTGAGQAQLQGTTKWYGASNTLNVGLAKGGVFADKFVDRGTTDPAIPSAVYATSNGDNYTAVFSYDNRSYSSQPTWPVALRFRYHVADPTGRLPGGRDFVQVVKLPN